VVAAEGAGIALAACPAHLVKLMRGMLKEGRGERVCVKSLLVSKLGDTCNFTLSSNLW
jgi:hypothetical protein